jgi:hypothetical protein
MNKRWVFRRPKCFGQMKFLRESCVIYILFTSAIKCIILKVDAQSQTCVIRIHKGSGIS